MGSVNVSTGTASGTFKDSQSFAFTISSAATTEIKIYGRNALGSGEAWFSPDPAVIPIGSTSVEPQAVQESPIGSYFTYAVTGMNVAQTAHIQVASSLPAAKKAS